MKKGLLFIVSAPAGTGKTTLVEALVKDVPSLVRSISYTTREPRYGEENGRDYFFCTEEEFKNKIAKGDFIEYVSILGNYYGTSRDFVVQQKERGKHLILVIDTQGAFHLKDEENASLIFISPPSLIVLEERLVKRGSESEEQVKERMNHARQEMGMMIHYDYNVVNEDLHYTKKVLESIITAEEHKIRGSRSGRGAFYQ